MYKQYLERTSNHLVILILVMLGTCSCFTFISGTICIRPHSAKLLFGTALIICQLFSFIFYYTALLRRRGPHIASHSVCPSVPLSLPSVTSRHLANYNDTRTFRHALRAAYRTAISAAQILVLLFVASVYTPAVICGQTYVKVVVSVKLQVYCIFTCSHLCSVCVVFSSCCASNSVQMSEVEVFINHIGF